MEVTPATPDVTTPPAQSDTPPAAAAEPVAPAAPEAPADQSAAVADDRLAQAEYTRSQQAFSQLRTELGLDKKATREQVLEAVRALRSAPAGDGEEAPEADPRIVEAEQRAFAAELRVQEAIYTPLYGAQFGPKGLDLINGVRQTNDPEELFTLLAGFIEDFRQSASSEPAAPAEPAPASTPPDIGLPEGDGPAASARPAPASARGRESGVVGAVRAAFAAARGPEAPQTR